MKFAKIGPAWNYPPSGIYLDNYSSNCLVQGNIVVGCRHAAAAQDSMDVSFEQHTARVTSEVRRRCRTRTQVPGRVQTIAFND